MTAQHPFEDFRELLKSLPPADDQRRLETIQAIARLSDQGVRLGRMGEVAGWLSAWTGRAPQVLRPMIALFAGTHGVVARGVTRKPSADIQAIVEHAAAGGAAVNQICASRDLGLKVFDLALDVPTGDFTVEAALDERGCAATMAFGMEAVAGGIDLLGVGSIGFGGETSAAAIFAALHGGRPSDWCETAEAVNDPELHQRQTDTVAAALATHEGRLSDPLEVLARLGGRECAAIAGAIIAARVEKVPVVLDGYVATAAAAVLKAVEPGAIDHCLLGHVTSAPAHRRAAEAIGLKPLLDLAIGEGEGLGAALGVGLVRDAAQLHAGMRAR